MRTSLDNRIATLLADHEIDIFTDGKGQVRTVNQNPFSAREILRHRSYFAAACHFAPILKDERLTRICATA